MLWAMSGKINDDYDRGGSMSSAEDTVAEKSLRQQHVTHGCTSHNAQIANGAIRRSEEITQYCGGAAVLGQ